MSSVSVNKFGNTNDDDDNQIVQPLYESQIGLDDLENVEGFKKPEQRMMYMVYS